MGLFNLNATAAPGSSPKMLSSGVTSAVPLGPNYQVWNPTGGNGGDQNNPMVRHPQDIMQMQQQPQAPSQPPQQGPLWQRWQAGMHPWWPGMQQGGPQMQMGQPMDWQAFLSRMFGGGQASPLLQAPQTQMGILGSPNQGNM